MAKETHGKKRGPSDATDYSSTQAPETQKVAEMRHPLPTDDRLVPGGTRGADDNQGLPALDRDEANSGGQSTGQTDYGASEKPKRS